MNPIDITSDDGAVVISIDVLREYRAGRKTTPECDHMTIDVDPMEAEVKCRKCGVRVNPVAWIVALAKRWGMMQRDLEAFKKERARLELRRRVVCPGCKTTIPLIGRSEDERKRKEAREARFAAALETIAVLLPEVAAKRAGEIARQALAARDTDPAA